MTKTMLIAVFVGMGCGGGGAQDARFAEATDEQVERALQAAVGMDAAGLVELYFFFESQTLACPTVEYDGDTATYRGGCNEWVGSMTIVDDGDRMDIDCDGFGVTGDAPIRLEGHVGMEQLDDRTAVDADLTVTADGERVTSHITLECTDVCGPAAGSSIAIAGVGEADVHGRWSVEEPYSGSLELAGEDELVFDFDHVEGGCVPYRVGDRTGSICDF